MMFTRVLQTSQLISKPHRLLRVKVAREINFEFENERKQFKKDMGVLRAQHRQDFWDTQTQGENMYLEKFRRERR